MAELTGSKTTVGVGELEGPEEVVGLLEVGTDGGNLVDEILNADDAELAKSLLDDGVVGQGNALLVDLGVTALVDELTDGLQVGGTVGDIGLNQLKHLGGGIGKTEEDTVVDLQQTKQLEDLLGLGCNVVDTLKTDNEDQLGLSGNIVVTVGLGLAAETDLLLFLGAVLANVLVSTLEDNASLGTLGLAELSLLGCSLGSGLLGSLSLLQEGLGDENVLKGGGGGDRELKINNLIRQMN